MKAYKDNIKGIITYTLKLSSNSFFDGHNIDPIIIQNIP